MPNDQFNQNNQNTSTLNLNPTPTSQPLTTPPAQPPRTSSSKNQLLPIVIILAIIALTGIGTSIFAFIQNGQKDSEISTLKEQLSGQNTDNQPTNPSNENTNFQNIRRSLADAKCLNNDNTNLRYSFVNSISNTDGIGANHNDSTFYASYTADGSLSLHFNWDKINSYGIDTSRSGSDTFTDLNFSGKVVDFLLTSYFGNADFLSYATLFALMEDGTVEYIPLKKAINENNIHSFGKLEGINNVIKFYYGDESTEGTLYGGGVNALARRSDGNYYNLYNAIIATGNY